MGPLLAMAVVSAAASGVHVEDDRACLDAEAIELEVRSTVGDRAVDELDLHARLEDAEDPWRLRLEVVDREGEVLWRKAIDVQPVDCPYLAALVARSVEQGLADVPGWGLEVQPRRLPHEWSFRLAGTLPTPLHFGGGPAVGFGIGGSMRWFADAEIFGSGVQGVGQGGAQLLGLMAGTGPGGDLLRGRYGALRWRTTLSGGPVLVFGTDFDRTYRQVVPRISAQAEVTWLSTGLLQVGLRAEVPLLWVDLVDLGSGASSDEPRLRLGLVLGIGSSEGGRPDRP